jgi:hypothetical protein
MEHLRTLILILYFCSQGLRLAFVRSTCNFISYLTENALFVRCKEERVIAFSGNSGVHYENRKMHTNTMCGKIQGLFIAVFFSFVSSFSLPKY